MQLLSDAVYGDLKDGKMSRQGFRVQPKTPAVTTSLTAGATRRDQYAALARRIRGSAGQARVWH